ncbi:hypothetical protein M885DRAFT_528741 [Pelagophyceae sp. CCMP2097]|nr:hypothetical protein M885DRAFT_528741 [Pelagophyceae sp. CCMP2097]
MKAIRCTTALLFARTLPGASSLRPAKPVGARLLCTTAGLRAEPPEGRQGDIGKQAKGFYVRPSAAIERGGGFFVPGLEGGRLRIAIGLTLLLLLGANAAVSGDVVDTAVIVSNGLGAAAALSLVVPRSLFQARELQPGAVDSGRLSRMRPVFVDDAAPAEALWAASAIASATAASAVALIRNGGEVVMLCSRDDVSEGDGWVLTQGVPQPTGDAKTRRFSRADAPRLFDDLRLPAAATGAVVVAAQYQSPGYSWLLALQAPEDFRDDDAAWCEQLLFDAVGKP